MTPERTCAICRTKKPKTELFRFVVTAGTLAYDREQTMAGRGVYFCSQQCWENARAKKRKVKIDSKSPKGQYIGLPDMGWQQIVSGS